jgi:hypothetical protein
MWAHGMHATQCTAAWPSTLHSRRGRLAWTGRCIAGPGGAGVQAGSRLARQDDTARPHRAAKLEVALRNLGLPPADGTTLCSRARAGPAQDCVDARAIVIAMRAQQRPDRPRPRLHATHRQSGAPPEPPVSQRARRSASCRPVRSGTRRCAGPALPEMMARVTRIELCLRVTAAAAFVLCCAAPSSGAPTQRSGGSRPQPRSWPSSSGVLHQRSGCFSRRPGGGMHSCGRHAGGLSADPGPKGHGGCWLRSHCSTAM